MSRKILDQFRGVVTAINTRQLAKLTRMIPSEVAYIYSRARGEVLNQWDIANVARYMVPELLDRRRSGALKYSVIRACVDAGLLIQAKEVLSRNSRTKQPIETRQTLRVVGNMTNTIEVDGRDQ